MTEMTCDDWQELLGDLVAGELAVEMVVVFEQHLCDCPPCVTKLELYRATISLSRCLHCHPEPLPPAVEARLRRALLMGDE